MPLTYPQKLAIFELHKGLAEQSRKHELRDRALATAAVLPATR
ncbi:hypothetical protein [Mesorhizobium sp. M0306]